MAIPGMLSLVMTGLTLYAGLYHLVIYLRRRDHREDLTFALLCFAMALYTLLSAGLYNAGSLAEGGKWQQLQVSILALVSLALLWFFRDYLAYTKFRGCFFVLSGYLIVSAFLGILNPGDVAWISNRSAIKEVQLPFRGEIIYYERALGPLTILQGIIEILLFGSLIWIAVQEYRKGHSQKARWMQGALIVTFVGACNDLAVASGLYSFAYLLEYTYLAFVILMTYVLAEEVVQAAALKDSLEKSEERLDLALRGADLGLWDWDIQTGKVLFDQRWAGMLGYRLDEIATRFDAWERLLHPEDHSMVMAALQTHLEGLSELYETEHRLRTKEGDWKWILARGKIVARDELGEPLRAVGAHLDITERVRAEQALLDSQQMLQLIMDHIPQAIYWKDRDFVYLGCNRRFALDAGLSSPDEIAGKTDFDLPWAKFAEHYHADDLQVLRTGEPKFDYEDPQIIASGDQVWMRKSKVPLRDVNGAVIAVLGWYQDITSQKRMMEVLKHSEERYRLLFQRSPVGIFHYDHTLHLTALNTRFAEIMLANRVELVGVDLESLEDQSILPPLRLALEGVSGSYEGPCHTLRGDSTIFISMRTAPYYNDKHEIRGGIAIVEDITERKLAEEAIRKRAARLELIARTGQRTTAILELDALLHQAVALIAETFDYYNVVILLVDGEEIVIRAATLPTFQPLIGKVRLRIGEQGLTGWVAKSGEPLVVQDVRSDPRYYAVPEEEKTRSEVAVPLKLKNKVIGVLTSESAELNAFSEIDVFTLQTVADQLSTAIGNARLYEAAQQEIRRRKEVEAEVRRLNEDLERRVRERTSQLEATNKELSAFSYSVSHDLRAPLRSIHGFSQALLEDYQERLDSTGLDYLQRLRLASQRMEQLIDALLELSRVTRHELHTEVVNLSVLAREIITHLQALDPERQVDVAIDEDMVCMGDARLLRVLLENLLSNAWKFTSKRKDPQIVFGVMQIEGQAAYFVRDNGAGFNMDYADNLFVAFQRLHTSSEFEGMGIGLATVQRIVHRHGGQVWAEGDVAQGATFYFTL